MSLMEALKYTAHLLLLLHLLHFIINACNKCVTFIWVVINMEWQSHVIFDSSVAPLFVFSSLRRDRNKIVSRFVSCVCTFIANKCATCIVRMSSLCQQISTFLRTFFHLFCLFPSFSFLSIFCFVLSFFELFQLLWSLLFHSASLVPFSFSGKLLTFLFL